uniref:F-box domain-containing protein n=1 Tax=Oryza punctata TaxID=4537 RepID=A0A0E0JP78_ORYPU
MEGREGGEEEGLGDQFERLPDEVLLDVFGRIGDVKALGRCALVSRRFHALVPLVDSVFVRVDCVISDDPAPSSARSRISHALCSAASPIQALGQILSPAAATVSRRSAAAPPSTPAPAAADISHHSPSEVLRSFKELRRLHIELPTGELGIEDGVLLKWKADFGSTLGSCVILGASSVSSKPPPPPAAPPPTAADSSAASPDSSREPDELGNIPESLYTNGGLKLRVVWTISSLIAASARHYLLQPIIADHSTLERLDLTDADGQGVLTMDKKQLQELRVRPVSASGNSHRTLMPALSMRLWYAPHVELPGGQLLKGATLVAIRPSEDVLREGGGIEVAGPTGASWILDAFEEPYRTAAQDMMRCY